MWVLLVLTAAATIYLGWHYVLDDLGGLVIGVLALVLASALTGFDLSYARRRMRAPSPLPLQAPSPAPAQPATPSPA